MSDERQASERALMLIAELTSAVRGHERDMCPRSYVHDAKVKLAAHIADLEADRARLDWMERAIPSLEFRAACDALPNKWPGTFREFVDAALLVSSPLAPTQEGA